MTRLVEQATTALDPTTAFEHVGDFANIDQWDPGVTNSVLATSDPVGVGSAYDLDVRYGNRDLKMRYVITDYSAPHHIVLEGTGGMVHAVDKISFEPDGQGTLVTYQADLQLTGLARLAQPFMKSRFEAVGESTGNGLRSWLAELERSAS